MALPPYIILHKNVGQTPLEVAEAWRRATPEASGVALAYAGRLDPMAEGQLLILIGEECKNQTAYHHLDKTYEVEAILGLASDSGDVLGIIKEDKRVDPSEAQLNEALGKLIGEIELPYPAFSSKTVHGKPLHTWSVEGRLSEITIPTKISTIYKLEVLHSYTITRADLVAKAKTKIALLPPVVDPRKSLGNDFRRPDVLTSWDKVLTEGQLEDEFLVVAFSCTCSSGTYMRTLADQIGQAFGSGGLALSINRTKIGHYDVANQDFSQIYS